MAGAAAHVEAAFARLRTDGGAQLHALLDNLRGGIDAVQAGYFFCIETKQTRLR